MKTRTFLTVALLTVILGACQQSIFVKRKHRDGFHWSGFSKKEKVVTKKGKSTTKESKQLTISTTTENDVTISSFTAKKRLTEKVIQKEIIKIAEKDSKVFSSARKEFANENIHVGEEGSKLASQDSIEKKGVAKTKVTRFLLGLLAISAIAGLSVKKNRKRLMNLTSKISYWAADNKAKARWGLAGMNLALIGSSTTAGFLLDDLGVNIPVTGLKGVTAAAGILGASFLVKKRDSFVMKKLRNALLPAFVMITMMSSGNVQEYKAMMDESSWSSETSISQSQNYGNGASDSNSHKEEPFSIQFFILKALLLILSIVAATAALWGVVALACHLSCSSMPILGGVVFFGGIALVTVMLALTFVKIHRWKRSKKK